MSIVTKTKPKYGNHIQRKETILSYLIFFKGNCVAQLSVKNVETQGKHLTILWTSPYHFPDKPIRTKTLHLLLNNVLKSLHLLKLCLGSNVQCASALIQQGKCLCIVFQKY